MAAMAGAGIDQALIPQILRIFQENYEAIIERTSDVVLRYLKGKHRTVFILKEFPDYVIKVADHKEFNKEMMKTIQKAQEVVKEHGLTRCKVPQVHLGTVDVPEIEYVKAGKNHVFIEEKLDGTFSAGQAKEESELEFAQMKDNPELYAKWKEIFKQTVQFICLTNYWDVDWRNVLLMKEGVGFIDFERTNEEQPGLGIEKLFFMAPPEFHDMILTTAMNDYGLSIEQIFHFAPTRLDVRRMGYSEENEYKDLPDMLKKYKTEELEQNAKAREFHRKKGITDLTPITGYEDKYPKGSFERSLIDKYIDKYNEQLKYNSIEEAGSLISGRRVSIQPFNRAANAPDVTEEEIEEVKRTLNKFEEDGVIAFWIDCDKLYRNRWKNMNFAVQF